MVGARGINQLIYYHIMLQFQWAYFEVVVVAISGIFNIHFQKADLDETVCRHCDSPAVVGVVGIRSGIKRRCNLSKFSFQVVSIHW